MAAKKSLCPFESVDVLSLHIARCDHGRTRPRMRVPLGRDYRKEALQFGEINWAVVLLHALDRDTRLALVEHGRLVIEPSALYGCWAARRHRRPSGKTHHG